MLQVRARNTRLNGTDLQENLPNAMRLAGYRTGASGKWHLTPLEICPALEVFPPYSVAQQLVKDAGFDWADGIYSHPFSAADVLGMDSHITVNG